MFRAPHRPRIRNLEAQHSTGRYCIVPHPPPPQPQPTPTSADEASSGATAPEPSPDLLLTSDLAPPANAKSRCVVSSTLPRFLALGGNQKNWELFARTVRGQRNALIMVHGPTGCGKTRGVHECAARALGMSVYELNASDVQSTEAFARGIAQVTATRTLLGPRLVLVDDIEGFDSTYIDVLVRILKRRTVDCGPVVLTCINPYDRALVALRPLTGITRIRMFSPSLGATIEAWKCVRSDLTPSVLKMHAEAAMGNFHQMRLRVRTFCNSQPDQHVGLFETTQSLLTRGATVDAWTRSGEPHVLTSILHENCASIAMRGDMDTELSRTADFMDTLSSLANAPEDERMRAVGMAAQVLLHAREVPLLRLSKRLREDEAIDLDMPALLRCAKTHES